MPQGFAKPEAISVTVKGVCVWTAGARVCSGKAGLNSGTFGGAVSTGCPVLGPTRGSVAWPSPAAGSTRAACSGSCVTTGARPHAAISIEEQIVINGARIRLF